MVKISTIFIMFVSLFFYSCDSTNSVGTKNNSETDNQKQNNTLLVGTWKYSKVDTAIGGGITYLSSNDFVLIFKDNGTYFFSERNTVSWADTSYCHLQDTAFGEWWTTEDELGFHVTSGSDEGDGWGNFSHWDTSIPDTSYVYNGDQDLKLSGDTLTINLVPSWPLNSNSDRYYIKQ